MKVLILNGPDDPNIKDRVLVRVDRWPGRKIRRFFKETVIQVYPIFTSYSLAVLRREGLTPLFLDSLVEGLDLVQTIDRIGELEPDLVFLETSTPSIEADLITAKRIKEKFGIQVALIDCHATYFHNEIIKEPFIDYIIRGEFEMTITHLSKTIKDGGDLHNVQGVTWKNNIGEIIINPDRELFEDLDSLPYPARDLVDQSRYREELCHYKPYFHLWTSRGCPHKCIFCLWPNILYKGKVRFRKVSNVIEEISFLKREYGAREIFIYDDTFNLLPKRVEEFCNELLRRNINIHWLCQFRPDKNNSPDLFKLMKKSGCRLVVFGVESGSQYLLDHSIRKGLTLDEARNAIRWCKEAGIEAHLAFVVGVPGETDETIRQTYEFIKEVQPDRFQVSIATPYPGTPWYEMIKNQPRDWKDFDANCVASFCENLTAEELENAIHGMYLSYYFTPSKIIGRILSIRSWDDFLDNWEKLKSFISRYSVAGIRKRSLFH